ncbi:immunoglobulin superfamily member 11 [Menidia menidia]
MGSTRTWLVWTLFLCFTAPKIAALTVSMMESSLEVVRGNFIVLPCSFSTSTPLFRLNIIWTLDPLASPESPIQVIVYDHGQVIEDPSLTGRVGFTGLPWSADIVLNDTRVSDAGTYRCMVNNPPEVADPGIGELVLSVLEPPSLPVCQWDGDMDMGGSVQLSCSVAEGVPTPDVRWEKMNPQEVLLPINMEGDPWGWGQTVNVSTRTAGLYRCSASNVLGTENCYVNVALYSAPAGPPGVLPAVLLCLAMSALLLALLLLLLWLRRAGGDGRKRKRERKRERKAEEACYNEIRYTPSEMKRSFV